MDTLHPGAQHARRSLHTPQTTGIIQTVRPHTYLPPPAHDSQSDSSQLSLLPAVLVTCLRRAFR
eukprot:8679715-Pyramimonas_sp.AAC.1